VFEVSLGKENVIAQNLCYIIKYGTKK